MYFNNRELKEKMTEGSHLIEMLNISGAGNANYLI
jgi:hypothetical protein